MNYETHIAGDTVDSTDEAVQTKRRQRIAVIVALVVIALIAVGLFAWRSATREDVDAGAGAQAPVVTVISPGRSSVQATVTATGTLAARVDMPVGVVGEGGLVQRVLVQPGDWVRAGQTLAVIERSVQAEQGRSLAAQIEVARADARLAQLELDRAKALVSRGFISQATIDQRTATRDAAVARVNVAIAQYSEQNARTGRLDIRAPAAGLVLTRTVEPGQVVGTASGTLFRLAQGGEMEMRALVSEADLARLRPNIPATVTPVGGREGVTGHVWQVSPVVDPQNRQGIARIAIPYSPIIRPGGFAAVTIVAGSAEAPLLPESAVLSDDKGNYVYVVGAGDKVAQRRVTVGQVSSAGVAVTNGLNGGERIVVSAGAFLTPGQKVRPELQKSAN